MKQKDLFLMMREQEIQTSNYFPNKKELELNATAFAKNLLESGEHDIYEVFSQAERASTSFNRVKDVIKEALPREKNTAYGIEICPVNGRQIIQFSEDEVYAELEAKLKNREELLKAALKAKETFYDIQGVEVPKVSVKYSKDSLTIKY